MQQVTAGSQINVGVAGGLTIGVAYLMDGGTYNDPENNLSMPIPFPDALQEFKVETSALPAQYGLHASAAVNIVTKSGANEFHGDAFEFVRNYDFNARAFFLPVRDSLKRNQFGGTFGGPIKKNKLFFFLGYQGTLQRSNPAANLGFVPTTAMLGGDFTAFESPACNGGVQKNLKAPFSSNKIDPSQISKPVLKLATFLPAATDACGTVQFGNPTNQNEHQGLARVDYQLSDKHSLFARYYVTHLFIPVPNVAADVLNSTVGGQDSQYQSMVLGDTYIVDPRTISSFRVTGNRTVNLTLPASYFSPADLGVNMSTPPPPPRLTYFTTTGGPNVGGQVDIPANFPTISYQFAEDISLVRGAHQIGFGVNYIHEAMNTMNWNLSYGQFIFSGQTTGAGMGDLFTGNASSFSQDTPTGTQNRQTYIGLYVQDAWKVTPRLTVNAGIRWDPYLPVTTRRGYVSHFEQSWFAQGIHSTTWPLAPAGVLFPGDTMPGGTAMPAAAMFDALKNFAPRLGIVWDPKGDGRMTIRAAYGIFYDLPESFWNNANQHQPPWGYQIQLGAVNFANPYASYPGGNPFPTSRSKTEIFPNSGVYFSWPLHPQPAYTQQWNFTLQKQIGANWLVSAGYLGNEIVHMWGAADANPAVFIPGTCGGAPCSSLANTNQRRTLYLLNPAQGVYYSTLQSGDEGQTQSYNGMLLALQRRLSRGVTLLANYTWSHCIGNQQDYEVGDSSYTILNNRAYNRGNCLSVDRRQVLNLSAVGEVPKFSNPWLRRLASGWKTSAIVTAQTGTFGSVSTGSDNALTSETAPVQRPNLILGSQYPAVQTIQQWLNPLAFAAPAAGTYGNLGVASVLLPGSLRFDLALTRIFRIREKQTLEVRGEAFNVLNRANSAAPNLTESAGTFGRITATGTAADPGARVMQFALKYYF